MPIWASKRAPQSSSRGMDCFLIEATFDFEANKFEATEFCIFIRA